MPFRLGPWEIGLILIVFGVGKLPEIGGSLGKGIRAFSKAQSGEVELMKSTNSGSDDA